MKQIAFRSIVSCCLLGMALAAGTAPAAAETWAEKIHPSLIQVDADQPVEFIVVLDEQADLREASGLVGQRARGQFVFDRLRETAERTQAPLIGLLEDERAEYRSYWIVNMIRVRGDAGLMQKLASRADVRRLDANRAIRVDRRLGEIRSGESPSVRAVEPNVQQINADQVWALGYNGTGIVVGGADTGYEWSHEAIQPQYRGWNGAMADHDYNWHDAVQSGGGVCGAPSPEPCDDFGLGHGTHTMGTMVGDDGGGNRIGISPGSTWIGCRNMDQGVGTSLMYAECFEWFVAPTDLNGANPNPSLAPHVINNSWVCDSGEGCSPDTLLLVVENTRSAGIVVVAGAGNEGFEGCSTIEFPPAIYDASITVGATDQADEIMIFSSLGPVTVDGSNRIKPDVSAPGLNVRSALVGGGYGPGSGTSIAGPHVSGVVALLLSARPDLIGDVDTVEEIIKLSALPRTSTQDCGGYPGSEVPNPIHGWGRVDALQALLGDADADGTDNLTDCKPAAAGVWAAPGAVATLVLDHDGTETTLSWDPPDEPGGSEIAYDLLRSTDPGDFSAASCLLSGSSGTGAQDSDPVVGSLYYLVRVKNACGENLGAESDTTPRAGPPCS